MLSLVFTFFYVIALNQGRGIPVISLPFALLIPAVIALKVKFKTFEYIIIVLAVTLFLLFGLFGSNELQGLLSADSYNQKRFLYIARNSLYAAGFLLFFIGFPRIIEKNLNKLSDLPGKIYAASFFLTLINFILVVLAQLNSTFRLIERTYSLSIKNTDQSLIDPVKSVFYDDFNRLTGFYSEPGYLSLACVALIVVILSLLEYNARLIKVAYSESLVRNKYYTKNILLLMLAFNFVVILLSRSTYGLLNVSLIFFFAFLGQAKVRIVILRMIPLFCLVLLITLGLFNINVNFISDGLSRSQSFFYGNESFQTRVGLLSLLAENPSILVTGSSDFISKEASYHFLDSHNGLLAMPMLYGLAFFILLGICLYKTFAFLEPFSLSLRSSILLYLINTVVFRKIWTSPYPFTCVIGVMSSIFIICLLFKRFDLKFNNKISFDAPD